MNHLFQNKGARKMLKLFGNISPRDRLLALLAVALVVLMVWLELKLPDSMAAMTTMVQTPGSVMADILLEGGRMLLYALGSLVVSVLVSVLAARIATDFGAALRLRLFSRVQDFSMAEIGRFSTASLITRSTNDVTQVQMLIVMGLQAMIRAPIMAGMAIGKIAGKSWQWTASTAVAVFILLVGITVLMTLVMPKFRMLQKLTDDLNRVTRENLTGLSVVRAYNAEGYQERKFDGANDALTAHELIKCKVLENSMLSAREACDELARRCHAEGVQVIGRVFVLYKKSEKAAKITLPKG
jgi:ATP-binding cassette subfamily B protein